RATTGRLSLLHDDRRIDLDPGSPSDSMTITLEPGVNAFSVPLPLDAGGAHRFRAVFEPTDASADAVEENNVATGVTFVSGEGRVLVLDAGGEEGEALAAVLRERGLDAERRGAESLAGSAAATISGFDAVVLANLPRWSIDLETDRFLKAYVHDLGGGLLMVGGDRSFGAGGWIDSETAKAIPVGLDPPAIKQVIRACVALVIDRSGSMSQAIAGTGRSRQEIANAAATAGIRSMHDLDELSVIAYDSSPERLVPRRRVGEGEDELSLVSSIGSGGGTDQFSAMALALEELRGSTAISRHMIVLTDGQTTGDPEQGVRIAESAHAAGITVTTIAIGDDANVALLEEIAAVGGGRFHAIGDAVSARELPEIFIREASIGGRSLIVEGEPFVPSIVPDSAGPLRSVRSVPPLRGYVLTVPREDLARVSLVRSTESGGDPIYAWWNHGTGRAVAFTSDFSGRWGREWLGWSGAATFWEETLRWLLRPSSPDDLVLRTRIEGDEAVVEVESLDS
ncbi:MAG: VWA domain-containing protein, partial [Phycisphaerae bacterium]|nr:VWA domain-containing protein [Phycisphaerae bacterium]